MRKSVLNAILLGSMAVIPALSSASDDVEARYARSCAMCHANGAANAPKTGDAAAWESRLAKGMDTLVASVEKGLNAMPPKGMCYDCSAEDYKALIGYMSAGK